MSDEEKMAKTIRWYDRDDVVAKSMEILQEIPDESKRLVASYLVEDIIQRKPYCDMFPLDTHYLILSENRRRRWYDFDETVRIFIELLRHTSDVQKRDICEMVLSFVDSLPDEDKSSQKSAE